MTLIFTDYEWSEIMKLINKIKKRYAKWRTKRHNCLVAKLRRELREEKALSIYLRKAYNEERNRRDSALLVVQSVVTSLDQWRSDDLGGRTSLANYLLRGK